MITPLRLIVLFIILMIVTIASWSKLRIVDEEDHEPQRWRLDEHPAFQRNTEVRS